MMSASGHAEVVGLTRHVGGHVIVLLLGLEGAVAEVAPQDRRHSELVGLLESLADFLDLPARFGGAEVDGGPDGHGPHVPCLGDAAEHHLVVLGGVRQQLVVIHLDDERNAVGVLARDDPQHAEGRGDGVAATLDRELDDVRRVEVGRVGREGRPRRVLDALVDREDRHVAAPAEPAVVEDLLEAAQDLDRSIGAREGALDVVGPRRQDVFSLDRLAPVVQELAGAVAEGFLDPLDIRLLHRCRVGHLTAPQNSRHQLMRVERFRISFASSAIRAASGA